MRSARRQTGFSLLEVLVAFSIMALALGVLYQAVGGSLRNLASAERHTHALLLAQSLLAQHLAVPPQGLTLQGTESGGYVWALSTAPVALTLSDGQAADWPMHRVDITIQWQDGARERDYRLASLLPVLVAPETGR